MKHKTNRTGGFTIIEVVLVLAVAGLIFLVVFAAIPRLQASRRDNQRKRDFEQIWAAMIEYEANTGSLPTSADARNAIAGGTSASFYDYIDDPLPMSPSGGNYIQDGVALVDQTDEFSYSSTWGCEQGDTTIHSAAPVDGSLLVKLERGWYCVGGR